MLKNFISFIISISFVFGWSQHIKFESFETSSGLSNNSVVDIENDLDGGLWIATWDGLNYYDGYKFTIYKHDVNNNLSIPGNYIVKLEKDSTGFIWIYTREGNVSKYIGNNKFQNFKFKETPKDIKVSKKGNIIVQTENINYEFIGNSFKEVKSIDTKWSNQKTLKTILLSKYPDLIINDVLKDKSGNVWYATRRNGLYIIPNNLENINNEHIDHYTYDQYSNYSFKSNEIEKLHKDIFGNIWLGHKDGGISMAYTNSEQITSVTSHPKKYPHLPNETLRAITKDLNGNLWLGYYTSGLFTYSTKTKCFIKFHIKEAKTQPDWNRIRTLFTASDGTIWAGSYAGLIHIKHGNYSLYSSKNIPALPNNRNYSIYEDTNKQLWIACWGGVAKFNIKKNRFETFKGQNALIPYNIRDIKIIANEALIATETNGVIILNLSTGKQTAITTNHGLLGNSIYSIYKDQESGYYWIASLGGISIYDKNQGIIKNITEKEGLPSHLVFGIIDNNDKIWISTSKGIGTIDKKDFSVFSINPKAGWQAIEFSEGAYYQDSKGMLFFGGINGLNYFKPSSISFKKNNPRLKIIIDGNEKYLDFIEKRYSNNKLQVKIKPIIFPNPKQTQVFYKLNNLDKEWKLLDPSQHITYENLPAGNYEFWIKNGIDNPETSMVLSLKILKPFYRMVWFYILLIVLILLASSYIIYIRNKAIRVQNKKLEELIAKRTLKIEHQKEALLTKNNLLDEKNKEIVLQKEKLLKLHNDLKNEAFEIEKFKTFVLAEFRTPISEIIKTVYDIQNASEIKDKLLHQSGKLINLISEWHYLDHIEDIGDYKVTSINLLPIIKVFIEKIKTVLQASKINFNCEINSKISWVDIDILRFKLLMQYFFHDIIKYSDSESSLHIIINYENDALDIKIESNSSTLKNNWYNIQHYSPYFKAVKVLLSDLDANISNHVQELFSTLLSIPVIKADTDVEIIQAVSWKHLNINHKSSLKNDNTILVYGNINDFEIVNQLLNHNEYNIFFESNINDFLSAIKNIDVDVVILYQSVFSNKLISLLNSFKTQANQQKTSIIYISEDINYELQEQSVELGIDSIIQLPASKTYINKKIGALIKHKDTKSDDALQQEIFQILTDEKELLTPNEKLIKKSLNILKEHLHDSSFNVEKLIALLEISSIKCYRLFKETLNQSPSDVITKLRLEKACYLLKTKNLNISEVSFECGYNNPKYFGRLFKKNFNISPKAFKEQHTEKNY